MPVVTSPNIQIIYCAKSVIFTDEHWNTFWNHLRQNIFISLLWFLFGRWVVVKILLKICSDGSNIPRECLRKKWKHILSWSGKWKRSTQASIMLLKRSRLSVLINLKIIIKVKAQSVSLINYKDFCIIQKLFIVYFATTYRCKFTQTDQTIIKHVSILSTGLWFFGMMAWYTCSASFNGCFCRLNVGYLSCFVTIYD